MAQSLPITFRFGDFELDVQAYELRRQRHPVRLERQPMELLVLLVERHGKLVTREDIVARLWGGEVFVDVETGINTAIRKIRHALNDSPDKQRPAAFVETVSGRGYRFVANVVAATGAVGSPVMVAVLPFVNLSGDSELDHLTDGLTEDAISTLGQVDPGHLRVIGRTSAMAFRGTRKSIAAIGSELNAQFVVEGSLRREGPLFRIQCALNRVADQVQLWSASYDSDVAGLAGMTRLAASALAQRIDPQSSRDGIAGVVPRQSRDAAAFDAYLRGRRFWYQLTATTTRKAIEYYTRATDIDPQYALAWAGITEAFASAPINGDAEPAVMAPLARNAVRRAVEANPHLSEVQSVSGQVNWFFEWDWPAAIECHRQAIALDPSNAWSHSMLGHVLSQTGRHDEARPHMEQACALEPMSALQYAMASQVAFQARHFEAARQCARRAIAIDPEFWVGHMMLGQACEQLDQREVALDALTTAARLSDGNSKPVGLRGYVLARQGNAGAARDVLAMLEDLSRLRYVPPFAMALVHAGLDDEAQVFEWLNRACDMRDVHLMFLTVDPKWDRYRSNPLFAAVLDRCGFER